MGSYPAVGIAFALAALSQSPAAPSTSPSTRPQTVTVRGCISGRSITDLAAAGTSSSGLDSRLGSSFRLKGSKTMMKEIERHNGHLDEIEGVVQLSRAGTARVIGETRKGKTRLYAGTRSENGAAEEASDAGEIDVKALTHVSDRCS